MSRDYFEEIEFRFINRRGAPFVLNAKDQMLIRQWHDAGIPLPIVLEAIDSVFDRFDAADRRVNGLSFCKDAVKNLWKERRTLYVGGEETSPEENPEPLLDTLARALAASPHNFIAAYATRVRELANEKTVPRIEERLIELEEELIDAILRNSPDSETMREKARALSEAVPEKTRARTEAANLRRLVREGYEIPRLSLF